MFSIQFEKYYEIYAPKQTPKLSSMDVNHAIALLDSNINDYTTNFGSFVHMKSKVQGWSNAPENWRDRVPYYFDEAFNLKIGNFLKLEGFFFILK